MNKHFIFVLLIAASAAFFTGCGSCDKPYFNAGDGGVFAKEPAGEEAKAAPEETAEKPAGEETKATPEEPTEKPAGEEAKAAPEETTEKPAGEKAKATPEEPTEKPAGEDVKAAPEETTEKPADQEAQAKHHDPLEEAKEQILRGELPEGLTKDLVLELFNEPYVKYASDTEIMEIWFYENMYFGFDGEGRAIKIWTEPAR